MASHGQQLLREQSECQQHEQENSDGQLGQRSTRAVRALDCRMVGAIEAGTGLVWLGLYEWLGLYIVMLELP